MTVKMFEWQEIAIGYSIPPEKEASFLKDNAAREAFTTGLHEKIRDYFVMAFPYHCKNGGVLPMNGEKRHITSHEIREWLNVKMNEGVRENKKGKMIYLKCKDDALEFKSLGADRPTRGKKKPKVDDGKPINRWCYPQGGKWYNREVFRLQEMVDGKWKDWDVKYDEEYNPMIVAISWECPFP